MADFCNQCANEILGMDKGDLDGLLTKEEEDIGYAASALCEGCGPIQVDRAGNCVSDDCLCKGHNKPFPKDKTKEN